MDSDAEGSRVAVLSVERKLLNRNLGLEIPNLKRAVVANRGKRIGQQGRDGESTDAVCVGGERRHRLA